MHWSSAPVARLLAVLAVVATSGVAGASVAASSTVRPVTLALQSGPRSGATYVALGDSYAAGEGLRPYERGTAISTGPQADTCHRSRRRAYADLSPRIVLPHVSKRAFWACSGATSTQIDPRAGAFVPHHGEPIQVTTVGRTTRFISLQVGGDDIGFSRIVKACIEAVVRSPGTANGAGTTSVYRAASVSCEGALRAAREKVQPLVAHLRAVDEALLARAAPAAELVLVGYPRVFPKRFKNLPRIHGVATCVLDTYSVLGGSVDVALTKRNAQGAERLIVALDRAITRALASLPRGQRSRVAYANTYGASVPQRCTGTTRNATVRGLVVRSGSGGITGLLGGSVSSASFHPSAAGQVVFARAVQRSFSRLRAATSAS